MSLNMTYKSAGSSRPKILMLHGNAASGQMFQSKTGFLVPQIRHAVTNAFQQDPSSGPVEMVEFHYPSSKLPVNPDQYPGEGNHLWTWAYGSTPDDPARDLEQSIDDIFRYLDENGPFLGIMGFSMGACLAAIIASLLEKRRPIGNFQFNTDHPPFKFVIAVCGFSLGHPVYDDLYSPKIETPIFLAIASLDILISESHSLRLRDSSTNTSLYYFEGTHHVPRDDGFLKSLSLFLEDALSTKEEKSHEEDWEDCGDH